MASPRRPAATPPLKEIQKLVELTRAEGLAELEVSWGDIRIRIRREAAPAAPGDRGGALAAAAPGRVELVSREGARLVTIEAPMVGTFYRAPSPEAPPYVNEGDLIKAGQVLCIIEAMKLMNEIESKVAGRIVKTLVDNAQPVEYGQPLFLVEPA